MNYYNEHDKFAAQWLRNLIAAGLIPAGEVDERSITEVQPSDLQGFTQCHFFAGIGGWSLALELAGWPTTDVVWTGSCPCQPFSAAGKRKGVADERHLWPDFYRLIAECRPERVFGEQVESAVGHGWLDGVFADLEAEGYTCGAVVLGAHSVGAPHIRQRLWWVADTGHSESRSRSWRRVEAAERSESLIDATESRDVRRLADANVTCASEGREQRSGELMRAGKDAAALYWDGAAIVPCHDGKARRIEPSITPLAHGLPARVVRLRGYGNAIVPQVGAEFIKAYLEVIGV